VHPFRAFSSSFHKHVFSSFSVPGGTMTAGNPSHQGKDSQIQNCWDKTHCARWGRCTFLDGLMKAMGIGTMASQLWSGILMPGLR
jgi:hypothetical protein